jgi:hypothetical protein
MAPASTGWLGPGQTFVSDDVEYLPIGSTEDHTRCEARPVAILSR